jgi:hypothetical protein
VVDPGRPVDSRADLDTVIAAGLGLDLAALRKTGKQVGMVAALAATQVPVADAGREGPQAERLSMLQQSLDATLMQAVEIAIPQGRQRTDGPATGRRRGRAAAPVPDALDELLDRAEQYAHLDPDEP